MSLSLIYLIFFFTQKTAYEIRISDWSSDVCSSDLDRRKVRTLIVLNDLIGEQMGSLPLGHDDRRDRHPARELGGTKASLAQTDAMQAGGVDGRNRDRLQDPAGRYRGRKLGQDVIVETAPGIAGGGDDPIQR